VILNVVFPGAGEEKQQNPLMPSNPAKTAHKTPESTWRDLT